MQATCVDLKELFGDRFKLGTDESYDAERSEFRTAERPWLTHVVCQNGTIGVWGDNLLVAVTKSAGSIAKRLRALAFVEVVQDGAVGANVVFDLEHFDEVSEIMRPRKRRRLSEEQRAKLVEAGAEFRYSSGAHDDPSDRSRDAAA